MSNITIKYVKPKRWWQFWRKHPVGWHEITKDAPTVTREQADELIKAGGWSYADGTFADLTRNYDE